MVEIEKIDVLTEHYNKKIVELLKKEKPEEVTKEDGSDS
jgi:hypothetical protein